MTFGFLMKEMTSSKSCPSFLIIKLWDCRFQFVFKVLDVNVYLATTLLDIHFSRASVTATHHFTRQIRKDRSETCALAFIDGDTIRPFSPIPLTEG